MNHPLNNHKNPSTGPREHSHRIRTEAPGDEFAYTTIFTTKF